MFKLKEIRIVRLKGHPDKISFLIDGLSPWPELDKAEPGQYPPYLQIECKRGYAEEWLRAMGFGDSKFSIVGDRW